MSTVRTAIYLLSVPALALLGWASFGGTAASSAPTTAATASVASVGQASASPRKERPLIPTRSLSSPKPRDAAAAYGRGDYLEALAQYRALARLEPTQSAYRDLTAILERRLVAKKPGE
jgi:hypothetical protein